ncbi:MAG: hypothetical protein IKN88_09510, partial [Bacteroidales bacterium]|nr:hypothetical protein [Bacteroidales bacterium]
MPIPDDCYPAQHTLEELQQVGVFRRPQMPQGGARPQGAPQMPRQPRPEIYDMLPDYTLPGMPEL